MNVQMRPQNIRQGVTVLDDAAMLSIAPSIFAGVKHTRTSEKYSYIPTVRIIDAMRERGFMPFSVRQSRSRYETRRGFAKHMIRFRHPDATLLQVGDTIPEVVLVNSHDGSSSYYIMAGLFKLLCLNGMIAPDGLVEEVRVPHRGDIVQQVIDGSFRVLEHSVRALEAPRQWSGMMLAEPERMAFATAAHQLRFADAEGEIKTPIKPDQLLIPRRSEDKGVDLWRTFNVVQENVIKGGLHATGRDSQNRVRRVTARAVKGIDGDVKLNRALWTLAAEMAKIKAA